MHHRRLAAVVAKPNTLTGVHDGMTSSGTPPSPPGVVLRAARESELALAVDIDDDAGTAYADAGLPLLLALDDPFVVSELARWSESARAGRMLFACAPDESAIGFSAVGFVDGRPHLEQLSVRRSWMRRGVGRLLVERAIQWSAAEGELWLTTYAHIPWNRPWYERLGFLQVSEQACGPELRATLEAERRALPAPEQRTAMCYRHR